MAIGHRRVHRGSLPVGGACALIAAIGLAFALVSPSAGVSAGRCSKLALTVADQPLLPGSGALLTGQTCSGGSAGEGLVRFSVMRRGDWAKAGGARTSPSGSFSRCIQLPARRRVVRVRAATASGSSRTVRIHTSRAGRPGCAGGGSSEATPPIGAAQSPPGTASPDPSCPLAQADSTIGMALPSSCTVVASDTAGSANPLPFWGRIDCADPSRQQQLTGGDLDVTALGTSQGSSMFRRLTVLDGDNVWGERCELGHNWTQPTGDPDGVGPTVFYYEGQRRVTYVSLRLPDTTPMGTDWRTVLQMKQTQPYNNPVAAPILELELRDGVWMLVNNWNGIWTAPARQGVWTRFAFDVTYSSDPAIGSIKVYVDLNGDGDFSDAGEQSPRFQAATLIAETVAGGRSPYAVGQSIPDHLRVGIYQDPAYSCPTGCSMDVDDVQVVRP